MLLIPVRAALRKERGGGPGRLQRLKWFCWHGNVFRALQTIDDILVDLDITEPCPEQARLLKAVREFDSYIRANAERIPN